MSGTREVDDGGVNGAHPVERIVFEIIDQFRSVGRPLRFYEVEVKLLNGLEMLRLPAEKFEKEKGLLRERLESLVSEKGALEVELRKMRDCVELSGVFSRLGWSGGVDATERSAEEIYKAMLSKLMSGNGEDLREVVDHLRGKVEALEAKNKNLKENLEQNVAKLRRRNTEDTELQYASFKRKLDESEKICEDLKNEKGILEKKNEVMQSDFDKLAQKNEKLEKKISWWKKNYEELDKRVIILEKDVIELKSCDEGILGHEDGREGHCSDEKLDSRSKNGKTCYAENVVGNGKHDEVIGTVLSVENRRNDGVHSTALSTGYTTPISGELVDLMDSDDDTALAGCSAKNKHSQNYLDKELALSSTRELKPRHVH